MCSHQEEQVASLKLQLQETNIHTVLPHKPQNSPTLQECIGSGVTDELTVLLDSAESGLTGSKEPPAQTDHPLCHQTHTRTAVVSPQKQRGNTMGVNVVMATSEFSPEKSDARVSSGGQTLALDGGGNKRERSLTNGYPQAKQQGKLRSEVIERGNHSGSMRDTGCESHLSVNLDLLALEVQDRIAGIFNPQT